MKTPLAKKISNRISLNLPGPFWQVIGLGILAGMRTFSAPVVASHILSRYKSKDMSRSPLKFMQSSTTALVFKVLAACELVGDKLPATPNRTAAPGLTGRGISGALAGASIFKASRNNLTAGALIGCLAAIGSTFGSFYLRKFATDKTGIIDPVIGAVEDALVAGASACLIITA